MWMQKSCRTGCLVALAVPAQSINHETFAFIIRTVRDTPGKLIIGSERRCGTKARVCQTRPGQRCQRSAHVSIFDMELRCQSIGILMSVCEQTAATNDRERKPREQTPASAHVSNGM